MKTHQEIVNEMLAGDHFSAWLGIQLIELKVGYCVLEMNVRREMLNGFGIAHGGITYSLADSALAFASNGSGKKSLSIETSIAHLAKVQENDQLKAIAECEHDNARLGYYKVSVYSSSSGSEPVALFRGMVYKTASDW